MEESTNQRKLNGAGKLAQPNRMTEQPTNGRANRKRGGRGRQTMEQPQNGRANRKRGGSGRRHTTTTSRINSSRRCLHRYLRRCVPPCLMVMFVVLQLQLFILYMDVTANFEPDVETQYDHPYRRRPHRMRRNDGGSRIGGIKSNGAGYYSLKSSKSVYAGYYSSKSSKSVDGKGKGAGYYSSKSSKSVDGKGKGGAGYYSSKSSKSGESSDANAERDMMTFSKKKRDMTRDEGAHTGGPCFQYTADCKTCVAQEACLWCLADNSCVSTDSEDTGCSGAITGSAQVCNHKSGGGSMIGRFDPSFSNAERDMMTTIVQLERQRWQQRLQQLPILLVGGSDGSGTRGVVDVLMNELYVDFIVEDRTTLDVHGQQMFSGEGWPKLVTTTLQATNGSLLYEYNTLPFNTKTVINDNVHKLIQALQRQKLMTQKDRQLHKMIHTAIKHSHQQEPQPQPQQQATKKTKIAYNRKTQQNEHNNNTHETTVVTDYTNNTNNRTLSLGLKNQNNRIVALQQHILETLIPNQEAATVSYGFKAPATMLLLPLFTAIMRDLYTHNRNTTTVANHHDNNDYPKVKFIHVVRDGRDVALSSNQSPVNKFYNVTYPSDYQKRHDLFTATRTQNGTTTLPNGTRTTTNTTETYTLQSVRAMQLWNDWNTQARAWSLDHPNEIDYFLLRTEDLLTVGTKRYEVLTALADFVGSPRPLQDLCCVSQTLPKDHGPSAAHQADGGPVPGNKYTSGQSKVTAVLNRVPGGHRYQQQHPLRHGSRALRAVPAAQKNHAHPSHPQHRHQYPQYQDTAAAAAFPTTKKHVRRGRTATRRNNSTMMKTRYGKWQKILDTNPELSDYFYQEGQEGLQVFGYYPYADIQYNSDGDGDDDDKEHTNSSSSSTNCEGTFHALPTMPKSCKS